MEAVAGQPLEHVHPLAHPLHRLVGKAGRWGGGGPLYEMKSLGGLQPSSPESVRSQNLLLALTLILTLTLTLTPRVTVEHPHSSPVRPP